MDQLITSDPTHLGPYRLIARLGEGGMGLVYLGRSTAGRTVAVKVVQAEYAGHPEFRRRFAREVAAARLVGGECTAAVLDADTEAALPWVATQYIPGPDLTTVVGRDFGPLPEASVRVLANRLALALQAVHDAGLIHRDLKPSNVLVTVDGPRVIDFGIARAMESLAGDSLHTRTGMLIGSPGFMSPEQVRGRELTPASDVFCLGAVLVHAATGRLLFGAGESGLNAHLFRVAEEEPDLTGVPDSLLDLVRACLAKDPAERPALREIAARTTGDSGEWLPGPVLAQLGRHAAKLLDFAPATAAGAPPAAPVDPRVPVPAPVPVPEQWPAPVPVPVPPPPPAYTPTAQPAGPSPGRRRSLAVAALAQLLVLLDAAALYRALPATQRDMGLSDAAVNWMVTGYAVALGGLLLVGARLTDRAGRKRTLVIGLTGFAVTAALGGAAPEPVLLLCARVLQGAFAALVVPPALALVTAHFTEPKARNRAFGWYAAAVGCGSALGMCTSAALSDNVNWRWVLYTVSLLALILVLATAGLAQDRPVRPAPRRDAPGLLLGSLGTAALAYGLLTAHPDHWTSVSSLVAFVAGAALLLGFVRRQSTAATPLVPPYVLKGEGRAAAFAVLLLAGAGTYPLASFASYLNYFQGQASMDLSLYLVPMATGVVIGATQISARLLHRVAPRSLVVPGLLLAAVGLPVMARATPGTAYAGVMAAGSLMVGLGLGTALMPLYSVAMAGVAAPDCAGGAAVTGTAVHLGGLLGAAVFATTLASSTASRLTEAGAVPPSVADAARSGEIVDPHPALPPSVAQAVSDATLGGYTDALWWSAGVTALAAVLALLILPGRRGSRPAPSPR
ncbi:MDR family MFS transporter [Streptomyces sp. NPDC050095]|uniref:MDR family MFS transporter n=1 Tax=unclassified Streptomyces TaxID=2593676 RepID=UPI00343B48D9